MDGDIIYLNNPSLIVIKISIYHIIIFGHVLTVAAFCTGLQETWPAKEARRSWPHEAEVWT